jgi:large subunit ribosomal protein L9
MQVVLRQDIDKLGLRGEIVSVARGYARNFLLPRGLAELATPGLVKELERRDAQRARQEAKTVGEAQGIKTRIEAAELRFDVNAGPTGALFGSVTPTNVADRLWEDLKIRVDRRKLGLDTIKRIGRYTVPVEVFADVTAELKLLVAPEGADVSVDEAIAAADAAAAAETAAAEAETGTTAPAVVEDVTPVEPEPEAASEDAVEDELEDTAFAIDGEGAVDGDPDA